MNACVHEKNGEAGPVFESCAKRTGTEAFNARPCKPMASKTDALNNTKANKIFRRLLFFKRCAESWDEVTTGPLIIVAHKIYMGIIQRAYLIFFFMDA